MSGPFESSLPLRRYALLLVLGSVLAAALTLFLFGTVNNRYRRLSEEGRQSLQLATQATEALMHLSQLQAADLRGSPLDGSAAAYPASYPKLLAQDIESLLAAWFARGEVAVYLDGRLETEWGALASSTQSVSAEVLAGMILDRRETLGLILLQVQQFHLAHYDDVFFRAEAFRTRGVNAVALVAVLLLVVGAVSTWRTLRYVDDLLRQRLADAVRIAKSEDAVETLFAQSLDGVFFMMLDEPIEWSDTVDKDRALEYAFERQRVTRCNQAMLDQYGATAARMIGLTPKDLMAHDIAYAKRLWRTMLDEGRLSIRTSERKFDGTSMWIEGEYVCMYDREGRVTGHFGVQREITREVQIEKELLLKDRAMAESLDAVLIAHAEGELWYANKAFLRMWGYSDFEELRKVEPRQLFDYPEGQREVVLGALTESGGWSGEALATRRDGSTFPVLLSGSLLRDPQGRPEYLMASFADLTVRVEMEEKLRRTLREREILLQEVHHRVKNNLQIVSSLLYLQAKKVEDTKAQAALAQARDRLRSIVLVHERLYAGRHFGGVELSDYVRSLVDQVIPAPLAPGERPAIDVSAPPVTIPIEVATPMGMIIVELVTNIVKYAYPNGNFGEPSVGIIVADGQIEIVVRDDGVGLPTDFDPERPTSFGWELIRNLTGQLRGEVKVERGHGTAVTVSFPAPADPVLA